MKLSKFTRSEWLAVLITLFGAALVVRMVVLQINADAELTSWTENRKTYIETVYPERGSIYDRWGNLLAGNKIVYEVGLELGSVRNPSSIATTLSSLLEMDAAEILGRASIPYNEDSAVNAYLKDNVPASVVSKIEKLRKEYEDANPNGANPALPSLRGVVTTPHLIRSYPEKDLASNILGFYPFFVRNSRGMMGVEEKYNDLLSGRPVQIEVPLDPYQIKDIPDVPPGASLILTIDRQVQAEVESILDRAVADSGSIAGTIIVENPRNGEILAMASTPRMDLNEYPKFGEIFTEGVSYNKAVTGTYEPGSVFKVLTMAAALDAGVVTRDTPFFDSGVLVYGGFPIYNWDRGAWGEQNMIGCMQHSLNVCLAWIATQKLDSTLFYQYLNAFGISRRTDIDLANEDLFPLAQPGDSTWAAINLATNSFGQGLSVTPIQMVMAVSAVANDGKMMTPHILKAFVKDGQQYEITPHVAGTPIKPETAHELTDMLAISIEEESSDAGVEGYRIAGKTGTAQLVINGEYSPTLTNASFVGWGPADDPQLLVYVWLEQPKSSPWGSVVAAPVFRDVFEKVALLTDLPPDDQRVKLQQTNK